MTNSNKSASNQPASNQPREVKLEVFRSSGYGKNGMRYFYVHAKGSDNKARRTTKEKVESIVAKWYTPLNAYLIESLLIASNSEDNALKEYWRICEKEDIGKIVNVKKIML